MAFDFPDSPAVDDEHTEGGVTYVFRGGGVWDIAGGGALADKVNRAGDTMSGGLRVKPDGVGGVRMSPGDAGRAGMFEFYDAADVRMGYIGWGNTEFIRLYTEPGKKWDVQGRGFLMNEGAGIHWGNSSAVTDKYNFSEGICLYGYGGTSQFGFTITSGTLNYCVQNEGNKHDFWVGSKNALTIEDMEVRPLNKMIGRTITDGLNGYFIGDNWHGMCFNGSNAMQFIEYHAKWQFVRRTTGTTGGTIIYLIDDVGSSGNSVSVTAPEALATARSLAVEPDEERGVDVMKVMAALLAKVNRLEAELATLKGGPTVEVKTVNVTQPKPTRAPPPSPRRR